ncbi:MAG TPA: glycosyltransferase family 39 protein [Bacteroidia bacterium]|nr:glycosyltransferase family 39 protein [Bacteroidia bacterium]
MAEQTSELSTSAQLKSFFGQKSFVLGMLAAAVLIGFRLLFFGGDKPLWIDERASVHTACGDSSLAYRSASDLEAILEGNLSKGQLISKIFESNIQNDRANALLYDYMLSVWMQVFGTSILSCRAFSALLFLLCIPLVLHLGQKEKRFPLFLFLLLLANSLLCRYSMECRTYMLCTFFGLLASIRFQALRVRPTWSGLLLYFLLLAAAFFSHYLSVLILAWHAAVILMFGSRREKVQASLSYAVFSVLILVLILLLDSKTGFIKSILLAKQGIAERASTSIHFLPPSPLNLIKGLVQVFSQALGSSLQYLFQIRYFAVLLILPLWLILKARPFFREAGFKTWLTLPVVHALFLCVIALLSGSTTIFQLCYAMFVLPYYLVLLQKCAYSGAGAKQASVYLMQGSIVLISCADSLAYLLKH